MAKKAKHAANQAALDRLSEKMRQSQANVSKYSTLMFKRAMESLATCPHAITTRPQALALKYVGPRLAPLICPDVDVDQENTNQTTRGSSSRDTHGQTALVIPPPPPLASRPSRPWTRPPLLQDASTSVASISGDFKMPPSAKEMAYEKAVQDASSSSSCYSSKGPWKVILILDGREQRAEEVQARLQMSGVPCEQRHLPIGDMAWMARSTSDGKELLLGTIVERKSVDDLAASLYGTRYHEQRLRLQHCGLDQVILLVEGDTTAVANCPPDTLHMAMMETRVFLNFQVVQTRHLDDTVRFLKNVHRRILQRSFPSAFCSTTESSTTTISNELPSFASPPGRKRRKKLPSLVDMVMDVPLVPPFGKERFITYDELKTKVEWDREKGTRTVGAIHLAMLKQISSLSHKKVQAIGKAYPTPNSLLSSLASSSSSSQSNGANGDTAQPVIEDNNDNVVLLQDLCTNDVSGRACRVGPKSALEVHHVYTQGGTMTEESLLQQQQPEQHNQQMENSAGIGNKRDVDRDNVDMREKSTECPLQIPSPELDSHHFSTDVAHLRDDDSSAESHGSMWKGCASSPYRPSPNRLDTSWERWATPPRKQTVPSSSPLSPLEERSELLQQEFQNEELDSETHVIDAQKEQLCMYRKEEEEEFVVDLTQDDEDAPPRFIDNRSQLGGNHETIQESGESSPTLQEDRSWMRHGSSQSSVSVEELEPLSVRLQRRAKNQPKPCPSQVIEIE